MEIETSGLPRTESGGKLVNQNRNKYTVILLFFFFSDFKIDRGSS